MMSQIEDEDDILIYQQLQELHVQRLQESRYELGRVVWESRCSGATVSCSLWCHCSGGQLASHPPTEPSHSKPARRKKKKTARQWPEFSVQSYHFLWSLTSPSADTALFNRTFGNDVPGLSNVEATGHLKCGESGWGSEFYISFNFNLSRHMWLPSSCIVHFQQSTGWRAVIFTFQIRKVRLSGDLRRQDLKRDFLKSWASLVAQRKRICLPIQETPFDL